MRRMICIRRCHGFRGGTWDEGEIVDCADGEDVPHHFIPEEDYDDFKNGVKKALPKNDPMRPSPQNFPQMSNSMTKQGMASTKKINTVKPASKAGEDI